MLLAAKGVLLEGMGWRGILQLVWPMLPVGLFTLTLAGWWFRRRLA